MLPSGGEPEGARKRGSEVSYSISQTRNMWAAAQTAPETGSMDAETCVAQIGKMTVGAISGGRVVATDNAVIMPVSNGYYVVVSLDANDTYTVRQVFARSGRATIKGEWPGIYCDMVGEIAYQASCFR